MNEKIYKVMGNTGLTSMILGILTIVFGISAGVLLIVSGARAIKTRSGMLI